MKTVTVGQLRQNPTGVLADVEAGDTYTIARHNHIIGRIVPPGDEPIIAPPRRSGPARTSAIDRVELTSAASIDGLIDQAKGEW